MQYEEKRTLLCRGAVDQLPEEKVNGILLVGKTICQYESNHSHYGNDVTSLAPAFQNGDRGFLIKNSWCPAPGYCAEGTEEHFISLQEGIEILIKIGAYEHLFKKEEPIPAPIFTEQQ